MNRKLFGRRAFWVAKTASVKALRQEYLAYFRDRKKSSKQRRMIRNKSVHRTRGYIIKAFIDIVRILNFILSLTESYGVGRGWEGKSVTVTVRCWLGLV